jgi:hypothetical protein
MSRHLDRERLNANKKGITSDTTARRALSESFEVMDSMMPGVGISLFIFAIGAILDFAVTVSPYQHGFNINVVGVILMIVGAIGLVLSLLVFGVARQGFWGPSRRRTVIQDNRGNVVRREDAVASDPYDPGGVYR